MAGLLAPQSLACPGCSAPFDYDGRSASVRCPYCSTVVAIPDHLRDEPGPISPNSLMDLQEILEIIQRGNKIEAIRVFRERYGVTLQQARLSVDALERGLPIAMPGGTDGVSSQRANTQRANTRSGVRFSACLIPIVILIMALGIATVAFMETGGLSWISAWLGIQGRPENISAVPSPVSRLLAREPAVLVSGGEQGTSVLAVVFDIDVSARKLAWIDPTGSMRRTSSLGGDSYADALLPHGELVYYANGSNLQAVQAKDGSLVWNTQMTDEVITTRPALVALGGRVIALTSDLNLQAFEASTGRPAWNRWMGGIDRQIRVVGDRLLVLDRLQGESETTVLLLNPADGSEELAFKPECNDGATRDASFYKYSLGHDEGVIYNPGDGALYLVYGSFFGCAQRYNLSTGEMEWETKHAGGFQSSFSKFNPLLTNDRLYFGYGQNLAAVNLATGELVMLLDEDNYQFVPLARVDNRLIVRAMSTRGTRKFELWALDPSNGRRTWQIALGNGEPLDPPNKMAGIISKNGYGFTWLVAGDEFLLFKFMASPNQVVLERLDLQNGNAHTVSTLPLKTTSADLYTLPAALGQQGNAYWVLVDSKFMVIDISTGELIYR